MRIIIGSDHAGFTAKGWIKKYLEDSGHEVIDVGCHSKDSCDYPEIAHEVVVKFLISEWESEKIDRAILICGTGQGMAMKANKLPNIRAALVHDKEDAAVTRQHNDANVLCLGARKSSIEELFQFVEIWLTTKFEGGRHARRVKKIG